MPYITVESGNLSDAQKEELIKRLTEVSSEIMKAFAENAFGDVICDVDVIKKIKNDKVLKASIY